MALYPFAMSFLFFIEFIYFTSVCVYNVKDNSTVFQSPFIYLEPKNASTLNLAMAKLVFVWEKNAVRVAVCLLLSDCISFNEDQAVIWALKSEVILIMYIAQDNGR